MANISPIAGAEETRIEEEEDTFITSDHETSFNTK